MSFLGAGSAPAGTSAAGAAVPIPGAPPGGQQLLDQIATPQGSPYIDARTRSKMFDANGNVVGQENTRHLVFMALATTRGTSVMGANFGLAAPGSVLDDGFVQRRTADVYQALANLVSQKLITIQSVIVDTTRRPVLTVINWVDNTTSKELTLTV